MQNRKWQSGLLVASSYTAQHSTNDTFDPCFLHLFCSAVDPAVIPKIIAGERIGTVFHPNVQPLK